MFNRQNSLYFRRTRNQIHHITEVDQERWTINRFEVSECTAGPNNTVSRCSFKVSSSNIIRAMIRQKRFYRLIWSALTGRKINTQRDKRCLNISGLSVERIAFFHLSHQKIKRQFFAFNLINLNCPNNRGLNQHLRWKQNQRLHYLAEKQ
jgi:hypothetical protein